MYILSDLHTHTHSDSTLRARVCDCWANRGVPGEPDFLVKNRLVKETMQLRVCRAENFVTIILLVFFLGRCVFCKFSHRLQKKSFQLSGIFLQELKQLYHQGIRMYMTDFYNLLDFLILAVYMASFTLNFVCLSHVCMSIFSNICASIDE